MAQIIAQTRVMSGTRLTSPTDTFNCIVEAYHNISEGEVLRVDFAVYVNGSFVHTLQATTRQDWVPNDSDEKEPLPGSATPCAPIPMCYGVTLTMSNYSAGTIIVRPTAIPVSGTSRTLDSIFIYNDKDGIDRRPSNKVIYVSPNGNNAHSGLTSDLASTTNNGPVKSVQRAIHLCKNGAGIGGYDVGGATIYLLEGRHLMCNNTLLPGGQGPSGDTFNYAWYTSGHHWLTITRAPGLRRDQVIISRPEVYYDNISIFTVGGITSAFVSGGLFARLRIKGVELKGRSIYWAGAVYKHVWLDGVLAYPHLGKDERPHVKNYSGGQGGPWVGFEDGEPSSIATVNDNINDNMRWSTGCEQRNTFGGWANFRMVRGFKSKDCMGIQCQVSRSHNGYCNGLIKDLNQWAVDGFFRFVSGPFTVTFLSGGYIRLTAQSTAASWGEEARKLVNLPNCGIMLHSGWATTGGAGDPNRGYLVTNGGWINGLSFVEFWAPNFGTAVAAQGQISVGSAGDYSATMWLNQTPGADTSDTFGIADPHSDLHQNPQGIPNSENWMWTNIRGENNIQTQGFSGAGNSNGFAMVNIFDGWSKEDVLFVGTDQNSYLGGQWGPQGIMRHMTIGGNFDIGGNKGSGNSEIIDCAFRLLVNSGITTDISRISHIHTIIPLALAGIPTQAGTLTTGVFFEKILNKYNAMPVSSSAGYGTASNLWNRGTSAFFNGHRGALRNVAAGNWDLNTSPVSLGNIRTINKTLFARSSVVTCGFPFDRGVVWSEADPIIVSVPGMSPQLVQWKPIGNKFDDGSIKYAKVSYVVTQSASATTDASLTLRGGAYTISPNGYLLTDIKRDNTVVRLRLNNQISLTDTSVGTATSGAVSSDRIPLSWATLIEGGGPTDHYARYRWFGRFTNLPHIWVEFVYEKYAGPTGSQGVDQIKFWLRFGNSYIERGFSQSASSSGYPNTFAFSLSSPVELDILTPAGATSNLSFEAYDVVSTSNITGGKRYVLIDPSAGGTASPTHSHFRAGMSKCMVGTVDYVASGASAQAQASSPALTMALNWEGRCPPWFSSNPLPAYITSEAAGYNLIENGHIVDQARPLAEPYSRGVFSLKPGTSGPGTQAWGGSAFWQNPLYHVYKSKWPGELRHIEHSIRTTCYRNAWWYERDGTQLFKRSYPNTFFYATSLYPIASATMDWFGYGSVTYSSDMTLNEARAGNGENYEGPDPQHSQMSSDLVGALLTCDYFSLKMAEVWAEVWAININVFGPNEFGNRIDAARASARTLMTAIMLYEITGSTTIRDALYDRFNLVYNLMNHSSVTYPTLSDLSIYRKPGSGVPQYDNLSHYTYFCPVRSLDKVRFIQLEAGTQVGNLIASPGQPVRAHFYAWQEAMAAGAYYQIYSILSRENPYNPVALRAKELAYDLSATCVLTLQKFGPDGENRWEWLGIPLPNFNLSTLQQWNLGSTVAGLSSGTQGIIFFQIINDEYSGGNSSNPRIAVYIRGVTGPGFTLGETIQNTTSGASSTVAYLFRGYPGVVAYRVDNNTGAPFNSVTTALYQQRQTPWTRAQLESYDVNCANAPQTHGQVLGASPYIMFYQPYLQWQIQCAVIAQEGCLNGFYTDAPNFTVAQLLAKSRDIISYAYNIENNNPQFLNGRAVWPLGFWPFLTVRSNFYQGTSGDLNFTSYPNIYFSYLYIPEFTIETVQQINAEINYNLIPPYVLSSSIIDRPPFVATTSAGADVGIKVSKNLNTVYIESDANQRVGVRSVSATIVIDNPVSVGVLDSTFAQEEAEARGEVVEQPGVIIHVILNMLLDGDPDTDGGPDLSEGVTNPFDRLNYVITF